MRAPVRASGLPWRHTLGAGLCWLSFRAQNRLANVADRVKANPFEMGRLCALADELIQRRTRPQRLYLDYRDVGIAQR